MTDQTLIDESMAVIDEAFDRGAQAMAPLLSGGHDSISAVFLASQHPKFDGNVYHIDTGIGAKLTRAHVENICTEEDWNLNVFKSPSTYEMFIRERGFPGPGMHQWAYIRLKERAVRMIMKQYKGARVALVTGCRSDESTRRMGHVEPIKIGEQQTRRIKDASGNWLRDAEGEFLRKTVTVEKRRYWIAPCHGWTTDNQVRFMDGNALPLNPIKQTPIAMSGECFCGAFARPGEIDMVRAFAPDVASEIDRLTIIAKQAGTHSVWGTRPDRRKGIVIAKTGPLCNSCDARAMAAGLMIDRTDDLQCELRD